MSKQTINSGSAPILWSTVDEAFNKINDKIEEINEICHKSLNRVKDQEKEFINVHKLFGKVDSRIHELEVKTLSSEQ